MTAATPRQEIRSITTTAHVADLNFPGVYQAWAITREVFDLHGNPLRKRNETVYGITRLTTWQANPAAVMVISTRAAGVSERGPDLLGLPYEQTCPKH